MKRARMILTALLVAGTACVANAQKGISMNLWNNNAPNDNGDAQDTGKRCGYTSRQRLTTPADAW